MDTITATPYLSAITCCDIPAFRCGCRRERLAAESAVFAEIERSLNFYRNLRTELLLDGESVPEYLIERILELERELQLAPARREGALAA